MASIHKEATGFRVKCKSKTIGSVSLGCYKSHDHAFQVAQIADFLLKGTKARPNKQLQTRRVKKQLIIEHIDLFRASLGLAKVVRNK